MKTDYTEEIRNMILNNYEPVNSVLNENEYTERKSLQAVYKMITSVLPKDWIYESDVYAVLEELGFKSFMLTEEYLDFLSEDEEGNPEVKTRTVMAYLMDKKTAAV